MRAPCGFRGPRRRRRAHAALAAIVLATATGFGGCGDDDDGDGGDGAKPDLTRIAHARAFQNGRLTLKTQSPESIGEALAGLKPTWVTGLFRIQKSKDPAQNAISGYNVIRDAVRKESPDAQFDVVLNALDFGAADQVERKMAQMRKALKPDGWFFDFLTPAYDKYPDVVKAAVADAHEHGEFVGGNAFGWVKHPNKLEIPPDLDFLAVSDTAFTLQLSSVETLAKKLPIVFHLANSPGNVRAEGCTYIRDYTTKKRVKYLRERARQQSPDHFSLAYPIFFPTCRPGVTAFDILDDQKMLRQIGKLMDKYN